MIKAEIRNQKLQKRQKTFQDNLLERLRREGVVKIHQDVMDRALAKLYRDPEK